MRIIQIQKSKWKKRNVGKKMDSLGDQREFTSVEFEVGKPQIYDPMKTCNTLNIWTGWVYEREPGFVVDHDIIKRVNNHLLHVLCSGDEQQYHYLLNRWKLILLTGRPSGVAMIFCGDPGCGKSATLEWFGNNIIGEQYYYSTNGLDQLVKKFNGHFEHKVYIRVEELPEWEKGNKRDHKVYQKVKDLITEENFKIRDLHTKEKRISSHLNFDCTSNFKSVVPINDKSERRMNPIECGKKPPYEKMTELLLDFGKSRNRVPLTPQQQEHSNNVAKHFFHFLMEQDISEFRLESFMAHKSELRKKLERESVPSDVVFMMWFLKHLQKDIVPINRELMKAKGNLWLYTVSEIYALYEQFVYEQGYKLEHKLSHKFSYKMSSLLKWWADAKVKKNKGLFYGCANYLNVCERTIEKQITEWEEKYRFDKRMMEWTPDDTNQFSVPPLYKKAVTECDMLRKAKE